MSLSLSRTRRLGPVAAAASLAVLMLIAGCTAAKSNPGPTSPGPTSPGPTSPGLKTPPSPMPTGCEEIHVCGVFLRDDLICPTGGCMPTLHRDCAVCGQVVLDFWTQEVGTSPDPKSALESG